MIERDTSGLGGVTVLFALHLPFQWIELKWGKFNYILSKAKASNSKNNLLRNYQGKNSQVHILLLNNIKFILQKEEKYVHYIISVS